MVKRNKKIIVILFIVLGILVGGISSYFIIDKVSKDKKEKRVKQSVDLFLGDTYISKSISPAEYKFFVKIIDKNIKLYLYKTDDQKPTVYNDIERKIYLNSGNVIEIRSGNNILGKRLIK